MYQSDIFCLVSNQSLIIDTEISKIISLSMIIYFFIFPQIIVLGSKKRGGALIGGGAINGKNMVLLSKIVVRIDKRTKKRKTKPLLINSCHSFCRNRECVMSQRSEIALALALCQ